MDDRIITGEEKNFVETQMGLEENLERGFVKVSKVVNGVKYYSITKKGEKHLKSLINEFEDRVWKKAYAKGYFAGKKAHLNAMKKAMRITNEQTGLEKIIIKPNMRNLEQAGLRNTTSESYAKQEFLARQSYKK